MAERGETGTHHILHRLVCTAYSSLADCTSRMKGLRRGGQDGVPRMGGKGNARFRREANWRSKKAFGLSKYPSHRRSLSIASHILLLLCLTTGHWTPNGKMTTGDSENAPN